MPFDLDTAFDGTTLEHASDTLLQFNCETGSTEWVFGLPRVTLKLSLVGAELKCDVLDNEQNIPRKILDPMRHEIRRIICAANAGKLPKDKHALLAVVFQALEYLLNWESEKSKADAELDPKFRKWKADKVFDHNLYLENPYGLDVSSVEDTASHFLGKTPEQICEGIPEQFRVIHIESIFRHDLAQRFNNYRQKVWSELCHETTAALRNCMPPHSKLADGKMLSTLRKEDIIDDMCSARVTYHGTPLKNVASIVRNGFKMPGFVLVNGEPVASPRSGIVFDRGIYSSQAPHYALSYASHGRQPTPIGELPTLRLFVCATIMGRTLSPCKGSDNRIHGHLVEGYDSHFDGAFEYIVHDEAAILPCYVIHLDLGSDVARAMIHDIQRDQFDFHTSGKKEKVHPRLQKEELGPGEAKREAERRKAAAMKWFSNGFGTSKGTHFVIEDIGEIDDDEEEYGQWQQDRHGFAREEGGVSLTDIEATETAGLCYEDYDKDGNRIILERGSALDQYQAARRARAQKRK